MKLKLMIFVAVAVLSVSSYGQTKITENTLKLAAGTVAAKATLADVSWLIGSWSGTGLGGVSEEIWSRPADGAMMGTYRLVKNGKTVFYEFMLLTETEGTIVLRIKHFHPNFVGWEDKDKSVDFKFVKTEGDRAYFSGLTFERKGKKGLNIYLALRQKEGEVREEVFNMKRVK
ncbi:MAG: DUF6265 family protein [Pyrinomonadaceae bacterium]